MCSLIHCCAFLQREQLQGDSEWSVSTRRSISGQCMPCAGAQGEVQDSSCRSPVTCRMGMAKAPVLPEPVCAKPMTSLPAQQPALSAGAFDKLYDSCNRRDEARFCNQTRTHLQVDEGQLAPVCWWAPSIRGQPQTLQAAYTLQASRTAQQPPVSLLPLAPCTLCPS